MLRTAPALLVAACVGGCQLLAGYPADVAELGPALCANAFDDDHDGRTDCDDPQCECDDVVEIAAGRDHTCARTRQGNVVCWGFSRFGELGTGVDLLRSLTPGPSVRGIDDAVQIAAGDSTSCALRRSGEVWCWGEVLADPTPGSGIPTITDQPTPERVPGLSGATSVSTGSIVSCAIHGGGRVACWGDNRRGQLGDGSGVTSGFPVAVAGLEDAVELSTFDSQTCARRATGAVVCWGSDVPTPVAVEGLDDAVEIDCGAFHACARRATGAIVCWGSDYLGQLGTSADRRSATPVPVAGISDAVALSAGLAHSCAILADGSLWCWGSDTEGQLGDGPASHGATCDWVDTEEQSHRDDCARTPVPVAGLTGVDAVSCGYGHTCALYDERRTTCWGDNLQGQLGDGTTASRSSPVDDVFACRSGDCGNASAGGTVPCTAGAELSAGCSYYHGGQCEDLFRTEVSVRICDGSSSVAECEAGLGVIAEESDCLWGIWIATTCPASGHVTVAPSATCGRDCAWICDWRVSGEGVPATSPRSYVEPAE